jgi:hypothetical protein
VANLSQTLRKDEVDKILSPSSTVSELHKLALGIQKEQTDVLDRRKMGKFIDVLDHYSGVFDVLSQCDFSYMTIIWGVFKFSLMVSRNHHNMLLKFTDMMIEIGLNLSRIELYRHIFPTGRMLELVAELYAAILEFLQEFITYAQKKSLSTYYRGVICNSLTLNREIPRVVYETFRSTVWETRRQDTKTTGVYRG